MKVTFTSAGIRIIFSLVLAHFSLIGFTQTGTISGTITDLTYKESLPGAGVIVVGTNNGAQSDMDGKYSIKIAPGTYSVKFSFFGYKDSTINNVRVTAGQVTAVDLVMQEDVATMDVVDLNIERKTNTESAVIDEVKNSDQVVSGISSEQISKSQDRDAAQAMRRIPGITIVDNRFIVVRGLSERYNSVIINDAISPSTAAERRSFAFDLIPSSLLDRMLVYKSGAADLPGDFAGGVIKIYTKNALDYNAVQGSLTLGYRKATTFNDYYTAKTGGTDFLGFDDGTRKLPSDFPKKLNKDGITSAEINEASKSLPNNFTLKERTALPDLRFNLGISRKFHIGKLEAGTMTAVNYSNTYQYSKQKRFRYQDLLEDARTIAIEQEFTDDQYSQNVRLGFISNWLFKLNLRNKIEFKNMFNQLGENQTIIRTGVDIIRRPTDSLYNYSMGYNSRRIYSGQLIGNHEFKNEKTSYNWVVGYSGFNNQTPDLRRFRTAKEKGSDKSYSLIIPPTATTFDAARFYSDLSEGTIMNSGNLKHNFFMKEDSSGISVQAGYYIERKSRSFDARWMSYKNNSANGQFADSISYLNSDQWFKTENLSVEKGLFIVEGTNLSDKYDAQNLLAAGYAGVMIPYRKFNLATGVRTEYNVQSLQSYNQQLNKVDVNNPILKVLPFVNLSYNFTPKMLMRAAYSKTLNRPEFREIAPFLFYDFEFNCDVVGNPDLKSADIHNYDLRWEVYPSANETFSIGAFYKKFINPIEAYIIEGADNPIFNFNNALSAYNLGVEVEFRKSLYNISDSKFIQNLSFVINGSLIESRVDLGDKASSEDKVRALQGQSPYVLNAGVYYTDQDKGWMVNAVYNITGKRIMIVGSNSNPTVYEMPRHLVDLTIAKKFAEKFEARLGVQDLLNAKTILMQDSKSDAKITGDDDPILSFRRGTYVTVGIGFNF